jgi:hypothetical protein
MRFHAVVVALLALLPVAEVRAAEITRIASSGEPNDPFGMYLTVRYQREQEKAKIVREAHQQGDVQDVAELSYLSVDNRLLLEARIGLWQDLEFRYALPVVFSQSQSWSYADGTNSETSTIARNCTQADGALTDPNCPTNGAGRRAIFEVPHSSYRTGLGNMSFGLAYALFNERKDPSKPMWILGLDYEAPTAPMRDPTVPTSLDAPGTLGDRVHKYTLYTAFSKRLGVADPYFRLHYTLPWRGPGFYSNCDHPDPATMAAPGNCGTPEWSRAETGIKPAHTGGVTFGVELNAYEDLKAQQKVAMDLRVIGNYVSEGRYYNQLTDVFGKLLYTQDHAQLGGSFGLTAWAAEYLGLNATATVLYATEHTLTEEVIGRDLGGDPGVEVPAEGSTREINPNFDYRADMVSRRFRASEAFTFRIDATATFNF